jgi:solute carrier family 12 sodium/potassium/chloride transporter 2
MKFGHSLATGNVIKLDINFVSKDPGAAIPKGTLLAILTTTASYIVFALLAGAETIRDASGPVFEDENGTAMLVESWDFQKNCTDLGQKCVWGSHNSFQVCQSIDPKSNPNHGMKLLMKWRTCCRSWN